MSFRMKSQYTFSVDKHVKSKKTVNPSVTIPDQVVTLAEIIKRHTRGQAVTATDNNSEYTDGTAFNDVPQFGDKIDQIEYARGLEDRLGELQRKLDEVENDKRKEKEEHDKKASEFYEKYKDYEFEKEAEAVTD